MPITQAQRTQWLGRFRTLINQAKEKHTAAARASAIVDVYDNYLIKDHSDPDDLLTTQKEINAILSDIPSHIDAAKPKHLLLKDGITRLCNKITELNGGTFPDACSDLLSRMDEVIPDPPLVVNDYSVLGVGAYGGAFHPALPNYVGGEWISYPSNVTKVFKKKESRNKALRDGAQIYSITGNTGHQVFPYTYAYESTNLPALLKTTLESMDLHTSGTLSIIRLPYLGVRVDEAESVNHRLQRIHTGKIIDQILKVLTQVKKIKDYGYIHADIREGNVLINPENGNITIIDFDTLDTKFKLLTTFDFDFYNNPPEFLLFKNRELLPTLDPTPASIIPVMTNFIPSHDGDRVYPVSLFDNYNFWSSIDIPDLEEMKTQIIEANVSNAIYLKLKGVDSTFMNKCLDTFDGFGLACSLLSLLNTIYPGCVKKTVTTDDKHALCESLRPLIIMETGAYSDPQLLAISSALLDLTSAVLLPMISFKMEDRILPEEAIEKATAIKIQFDTAFSLPATTNTRRRRTRRNGYHKKRKQSRRSW